MICKEKFVLKDILVIVLFALRMLTLGRNGIVCLRRLRTILRVRSDVLWDDITIYPRIMAGPI